MKKNKRYDDQEKSIDPATLEMLRNADQEGLETAWDRLEAMEPQCKFGLEGTCCRICNMGPCRIVPNRTETGVCGANEDTITARNLIRMIAGGAAAHSDHGRDVAKALLLAATEKKSDYEVKDPYKLRAVAVDYGIDLEDKNNEELAKEVAEKALSEFGQQTGTLQLAERAPEARLKKWREQGVMPRGVDREITEIMHRTHMGVDTDYNHLIRQGIRASLSDGWGGSMIATDLQDILFGTPSPLQSTCNLGTLEEDEVNIIVHGHEPTLSEVVLHAARDPELINLAKQNGAKGINIAGLCCTANEILMRHGIPTAGNFLQQELAVMTGATDLMMVDVQCIMPALSDLVNRFHTKLVTTSPKAKFPGVEHIEFEEESALEIAKKLVKMGVDNFENRDKEPFIPDETMDLIGGFSSESVFHFLGGTYRATYRPLNDAIIDGRLRGVAGVVGCNNPKITHDFGHVEMAKELIKHDILVVTGGCSAIADAKAGLMKPEAAFEYAGEGLTEICRTVGLPPVLHLGS